MAYGLPDDEDRLRLDPEVAAWVQQIRGRGPATAPPAGPAVMDEKALAELQALDTQERAGQGKIYLGGMLDDAGAMIRGKDRPFRAPPPVDDSIRKFIISRKMATAPKVQDPTEARIRQLRADLMEKELAGQPKAIPFSEGPPTVSQREELRRMGKNPDAFPTAGWAQQAIVAAAGQAATQTARAEDRSLAEKKAEEKAGNDLFIASDFVPGAGARPVETAVKTQLFNKAANGSSMIANSRKLAALVEKHGGGAIVGPIASEMSGLATDLVMGGKEVYGLGVLNPNDEVILGRIIADPTKIGSIASDAAGARSLAAIYKTLEDVMRRRVNAAFAQAGHAPKPGSLFAEPKKVVEKRRAEDGRILVKYDDGSFGEEGK